MPVIEERYDQKKIDGLKRYLRREAEKGRTRDYEIIVDGFKVVSRTDDVEEFDDYEEEIQDSTRNLSILVYDGAGTNRNTRYSFALNQDGAAPIPAKPVNGLGGLAEIDEIIQLKLDEKDRDYKMAATEKELAETQQKLTEAEDYIKQLELAIVQMKEAKPKPNALNVQLGEIGATLLDGLLKKNIPQLSGILSGLNGLTAQQETTNAAGQEQEAEVTFQRQADAASGSPLTEQQRNYLNNLELMEKAFSAEQLQIVIAIIHKLMQHTEQVIPVAQFLNLDNCKND